MVLSVICLNVDDYDDVWTSSRAPVPDPTISAQPINFALGPSILLQVSNSTPPMAPKKKLRQEVPSESQESVAELVCELSKVSSSHDKAQTEQVRQLAFSCWTFLQEDMHNFIAEASGRPLLP